MDIDTWMTTIMGSKSMLGRVRNCRDNNRNKQKTSSWRKVYDSLKASTDWRLNGTMLDSKPNYAMLSVEIECFYPAG